MGTDAGPAGFVPVGLEGPARGTAWPAAAWLPDDEADLIGPGIAIDETAQLKHGDATACVAPQHAGCTDKVETCVTTVFSAYVTAAGQVWADFDVYMPDRWAQDLPRRRAAGIPDDLEFAAKPQVAVDQLGRLLAAGLPARWPHSTISLA
jgi:SRSO17 transposase